MTDSKMTTTSNNESNFVQRNWRSSMAVQYLVVCLFDFMLAPIFLGYYSWITNSPYIPWVPLTLQGAGVYHLSMGAIVGVTSWAKTKEKIIEVAK